MGIFVFATGLLLGLLIGLVLSAIVMVLYIADPVEKVVKATEAVTLELECLEDALEDGYLSVNQVPEKD